MTSREHGGRHCLVGLSPDFEVNAAGCAISLASWSRVRPAASTAPFLRLHPHIPCLVSSGAVRTPSRRSRAPAMRAPTADGAPLPPPSTWQHVSSSVSDRGEAEGEAIDVTRTHARHRPPHRRKRRCGLRLGTEAFAIVRSSLDGFVGDSSSEAAEAERNGASCSLGAARPSARSCPLACRGAVRLRLSPRAPCSGFFFGHLACGTMVCRAASCG